MIAALFAAAASATAPTLVTICVKHQTDYEDADYVAPAIVEDFFATNADKPARGIKVWALPADGSPDQVAFAEWRDGQPLAAGCVQFSLDANAEYAIVAESVAVVNGNTFTVWKNHTGPDHHTYSWALLPNYVPAVDGTVKNRKTPLTADGEWNVVAAVGHALWRRNGGLSESFDVYLDPGTQSSGTHSIQVGHITRKKTGIVHELGHHVQMARDGYSVNLVDWYAEPDGCSHIDGDKHELQEKAYQSEAIVEAWAQFYVGVAFNSTNQSNGAFHYYDDQDYDLDPDTNNTSLDGHLVSLELGPGVTAGVPVDEKDYYGDWCAPRGGVQTNRATQLDWLRFFWDFMTDEPAVEYSDVLDIVDAADPRDWNPADAGPPADRPAARMLQAAHAHLANDLDWDDHLDNGNGR